MLCVHVVGEYLPAMHHVAGTDPPTMHLTTFFACGGGVLPSLALDLLVRSGTGVFPAVPHVATEILPRHTQCGNQAAPGLHSHRRHAGLGPPPPPPATGGAMDYDDGLMISSRLPLSVTLMFALLFGCHIAATVFD